MQGEIHLPNDRVKKEFRLALAHEHAIRHEENRGPLLFTRRDESVERGMNERISHEMETNLVGHRPDLHHNFLEEDWIHQAFGPHDFGTEAALEITNITDLDIDLREALLLHISLLHILPLA